MSRRDETDVIFGASDDYAVLRTGVREFYYGYEVTRGGNEEEGEPGEWCFQARRLGGVDDVAIIPRSELEARSDLRGGESPEAYLLVGIGLYLRLPTDPKVSWH